MTRKREQRDRNKPFLPCNLFHVEYSEETEQRFFLLTVFYTFIVIVVICDGARITSISNRKTQNHSNQMKLSVLFSSKVRICLTVWMQGICCAKTVFRGEATVTS